MAVQLHSEIRPEAFVGDDDASVEGPGKIFTPRSPIECNSMKLRFVVIQEVDVPDCVCNHFDVNLRARLGCYSPEGNFQQVLNPGATKVI